MRMNSAPEVNGVADEEIIRRVQQGEGKLFSVIFERYYSRLERFIRQLGLPEADLEDALAETFSRAYTRVRSFNPDAGARYVSYLYAIARNLTTDRLRERGRAPEMSLLDEAGAGSACRQSLGYGGARG
jgi:RNA polymerase sigma-70 factor (ECF subfamily)